MRNLFAAASAALLATLAMPASATVFFGNFDPSDTTATAVGALLPLDYRTPAASNPWDDGHDASFVAQYGFVCCAFDFHDDLTAFVAPTSFTAARLIVPLSFGGSVGNRRVGFNIEHKVGNAWEGLGFGQVESGLLPQNGAIVEVEVPFGNVFGSDFAAAPIAFVAGEEYRIRTSHAAGGSGTLNWYYSDEAAAVGQTFSSSTRYGITNLSNQLAFALTDGGSLDGAAADVPEPAMLGLFGLGAIGLAAGRRRRRTLC